MPPLEAYQYILYLYTPISDATIVQSTAPGTLVAAPSSTMSASLSFTADLRSSAREFNRDKNSRAKWAHGQSYGPGRREEDGKPRPAKPYSQDK